MRHIIQRAPIQDDARPSRVRCGSLGKALRLVALCFGLAASLAHAQSFPTKPVTVVVPFPAGSTTDVIIRLAGPRMQQILGQPLIVDNRVGAAGSIGTALVARAPADGYTLLFTSQAHTANSSLYPNLPWDPVKSFAPVLLVGSIPNVFAVRSSEPFKTLEEFIAFAKSKPGQLNYASSGVGTSPHLTTELLKQASAIELTHVPYKSSPEALNALIAGDVAMAPLGIVIAKSQIEAGKVRALAVSSSTRSRVLPNVPPVAESGIPNYDVRPLQAIFAPAGTPRGIVDQLNAAFTKALTSPEIESKLVDLGVELDLRSPQETGKFIQADVDRWSVVIKRAGIRLD
ncbi:tripartite tricarboxylate transporter substrate binding protein [Variovorax rhizosphaerae]|uniref:Tripartite tricarboxylate transporter substrate binding protein n=1 Tax=Variovorax rhizosphaerae TaxID=1836200 RepID=A0ABU8WTC0_9BURK